MYAGALVVDAHQHVWNPARAEYPWLGPELAPINRAIEFDELAPTLDRCGIDATVLVQSADNAQDTEYMLGVAARYPQVAAVVAYLPLDRPAEAAAAIDRLRTAGPVVGVRNLIHTRSDPDWLLRPEVDEGLGVLEAAGLTFDVVSVLPRHLEHVPGIAERHPDLRLVIDHLSKPPVKAEDWQPWRSLIAEAARCPTVYAKISGLYPASGPPDEWDAGDVEPFVHLALDLFGADRLMYGGDWPISIRNGGYDKVWRELTTVFDRLSEAERGAVLSGTAIDFYRIPTDRLEAARR